MKLPLGYYAVGNTAAESGEMLNFDFRGYTYSVTAGVNYFGSLSEAQTASVEAPRERLVGVEALPETPTVIFSSGEYYLDRNVMDRSLTLFGNHAGISPNLEADEQGIPTENPEWSKNATVLIGSTWHGICYISSAACESLVFDGFVFNMLRIQDARRDGGHFRSTFRNIKYVGGCGFMPFNFYEPKGDGNMHREVLLENIRVDGFDGLDGDAIFLYACAEKLRVRRVVYANTDKCFGLTDWRRNWSSFPGNSENAEIAFEDCCFAELSGCFPISTSNNFDKNATEHPKVKLSVRGCKFLNASLKNTSVFSLENSDPLIKAEFTDCIFKDSRGNVSPAIELRGNEGHLSLENCSFDGFSTSSALVENSPMSRTAVVDDPHETVSPDKYMPSLEALYAGRKVFFGDLHIHTNSGGCSDGSAPIADWPQMMREKQLDFAAVVDHRQMRHMYLSEWEEELFICGTEPGTHIIEGLTSARVDSLHYNMLFREVDDLKKVLAAFPEYGFEGDELNGFFIYPRFAKSRFCELASFVREIGGCFVHVHPKQIMISSDPLDYYFGERTFIETIYGSADSFSTLKNRQLWLELLALGKRVWATSGSDSHSVAMNSAVAAVYSESHVNRDLISHIYNGDLTAGSFGIKMSIGDVPMGGDLAFADDLVLGVEVSDSFEPLRREGTVYELRIYSDRGVAYSKVFDGKAPISVGFAVKKRGFYRAEIYNLTDDHTEALGNPIWFN